MITLLLVPSGQTDWHDQGRLTGDSELPLSDTGRQQATDWADQLKQFSVQHLFSGSDEPAVETARLIGAALKLKPKAMPQLDEVSLGLWQGLRIEEIKQRHPRVWKQWRQQPDTVCPPEGETLKHAHDRLSTAIQKIIAKRRNTTIAMVLGPVALAVVRAGRESIASDQIWAMAQQPAQWYKYDIEEPQPLTKGA